MKVNFEQTFRQLLEPEKPLFDGPEPQPGVEDTREPIGLKTVALNALMAVDPQAKISGEEKAKRYDLAMKIVAGKDEYPVEDIALVKKLIGEGFGPLIVGQANKMLEGEKVLDLVSRE